MFHVSLALKTTGRTMGTSTLLAQMHSMFSRKKCRMSNSSAFVHWVAKKFPVFSWLSNDVDDLKEALWDHLHSLKVKSRPKQSERWPVLRWSVSSFATFFRYFPAVASGDQKKELEYYVSCECIADLHPHFQGVFVSFTLSFTTHC